MIRSALVTFSLLVPSLINAQGTVLEWGAEMSCGSSAEGALSPRVQVNGANAPVVMWGRSAVAANFVAVGNGASFSLPVLVHPATLNPAAMSWTGGDLAADGATVWAVMKAAPEHSNPCYAVRSDDGGYTWGDTIRVDPSDGTLSRFPSIAIVPGVGPIVQYMQFDELFSNARYVTSRMVSGVFQPPVQVSAPFAMGDVCDCCPGQVITNGGITASLYRNAGMNIRVIWGGASMDGGQTYTAGAQLDATNWNYGSCPSSGPDGYIAGDSVRYVWMSGASGSTRVYVGSAVMPGLIPGPQHQIALTATGSQNFPKIDGQGDTLGTVWARSGGGVSGIFFSYSTTGIAGLSQPDTLAWGEAGDFQTPDITYKNGTFHIVWQDNTLGVVRYRSASLVNTTTVNDPSEVELLDVWPVPTVDILNVPGATGAARAYTILDAAGRTVSTGLLQGERLSVDHLAPGPYRLIVVEGRTTRTANVVIE